MSDPKPMKSVELPPTKPAARRRAPRPKAHGPKALTGGRDAKRQAAILLEVLAGLRSASDASSALGISIMRYYMLETRALQGLVAALEPRARGRQRQPEDEIETLRRDKRRLEQEVARTHALVRTTQRAIGLQPPAKAQPTSSSSDKAGVKKARRTRKPRARAAKAAAALLKSLGGDEAAVVTPGAAS